MNKYGIEGLETEPRRRFAAIKRQARLIRELYGVKLFCGLMMGGGWALLMGGTYLAGGAACALGLLGFMAECWPEVWG